MKKWILFLLTTVILVGIALWILECPDISVTGMQIQYIESTFAFDEENEDYEAGFTEPAQYIDIKEEQAKKIKDLLEHRIMYVSLFPDKNEEREWTLMIFTNEGDYMLSSAGSIMVNGKRYHYGIDGKEKAERILQEINEILE